MISFGLPPIAVFIHYPDHYRGNIETGFFTLQLKRPHWNRKTSFWLIRQIQNLKVPFVIENPVGMMSKQWFMKPLHKVKISLCQYGANVMKPTHLMGEIPAHFRPLFCGNGRLCHEAAPRSSKTGTQGLEDAETRAMMPYGLSMAIYQAFLTSNGQTYSRLSDFI